MTKAGRVITAVIPEDLAAKLDTVAARTERSKSWIVRHAIAEWVAEEMRRHELTLEAMASIDRGEGIPHEQIVEQFATLRAKRRQKDRELQE